MATPEDIEMLDFGVSLLESMKRLQAKVDEKKISEETAGWAKREIVNEVNGVLYLLKPYQKYKLRTQPNQYGLYRG